MWLEITAECCGGAEGSQRKLVVLVLDDFNRQCAELALLAAGNSATFDTSNQEKRSSRSGAIVEVNGACPFITLSIWGSREQPQFLHHIESVRVDLDEWSRLGYTARAIPLRAVSGLADKTNNLTLCFSVSRVKLTNMEYLNFSKQASENHIDKPETDDLSPASDAGDTTQSVGFHFRMPSVPITRSRRFRDVKAGQIVHERRTDILEALLPTILYALPPSHSGFTQGSEAKTTDAMHKALTLLQFSCQYAQHCTGSLEEFAKDLYISKCSYQNRLDNMKLRRRRLKDRASNLQFEKQTLNTSLEELRAILQAILQEMDPGVLAKMQDEDGCQTELSSLTTSIKDGI